MLNPHSPRAGTVHPQVTDQVQLHVAIVGLQTVALRDVHCNDDFAAFVAKGDAHVHGTVYGIGVEGLPRLGGGGGGGGWAWNTTKGHLSKQQTRVLHRAIWH